MFTFKTDGCNLKVGRVLLQDQTDGTKKLVVYFSMSPDMAEKAYDTTYRECLAVVCVVQLFTALRGIFHTV